MLDLKRVPLAVRRVAVAKLAHKIERPGVVGDTVEPAPREDPAASGATY